MAEAMETSVAGVKRERDEISGSGNEEDAADRVGAVHAAATHGGDEDDRDEDSRAQHGQVVLRSIK